MRRPKRQGAQQRMNEQEPFSRGTENHRLNRDNEKKSLFSPGKEKPQMTQIPQKIDHRFHRFAPIATPESTKASQKTKLTLRLCSLCAWRYAGVTFGSPVCLGVFIAGGLNSYELMLRS